MVKNNIKVYLRIKKESTNKKLVRYEIVRRKTYDNLVVKNHNEDTECSTKTSNKFRFLKALDQESSQLDVFESIAKPVVNSVINGFNGTIFAYGQTGSGKTYAITGSPREYNDRGIIPRSIEHIFEHVDKSPYRYTVYISYLEIYNESGYDLLNARHKPPSHMEELPRVVLLEDGKGEYHLRNLSVHSVSTVQEAMRLLFLGDTNRTIVETPMNEFSSRSHCVFTVYICSRGDSGSIRRSKLNLVDLAGSERVYKSNISGQTLTEAKYINLSLLYLEQVITALSEAKRPHVPFRNSMMTYMLKDSLNGNSLAAMLATVSMNLADIEETISTCKFAQRVSLVSTEPTINEEIDFQQQIEFLGKENSELRKQLHLLRSATKQEIRPLTSQEEQHCKQQVERFLANTQKDTPLDVQDFSQIQFCINFMKQLYKKEKSDKARIITEETLNRETVEKYKKVIDQKDDEIFVLNELVETLSRKSSVSLIPPTGLSKEDLNQVDDTLLFEHFASDPNNMKEIDYFNNAILDEYSVAKKLSRTIEDLRKEIIRVKSCLESDAVKSNEKTTYEMILTLMRLQDYYQKTLVNMQEIKQRTEHLNHGLQQAQMKLKQKFDKSLRGNAFPTRKLPSFKSIGSYKVTESRKYHEDTSPRKNILKRNQSEDYLGTFDPASKSTRIVGAKDGFDYHKIDEILELSPTKLKKDYLLEGLQKNTTDSLYWHEPTKGSIESDMYLGSYEAHINQKPLRPKPRSRSNSRMKQPRQSVDETCGKFCECFNASESSPNTTEELFVKSTISQLSCNYSLINNLSSGSLNTESCQKISVSPFSDMSIQNSYSDQKISNVIDDSIRTVESSDEYNQILTSETYTNTPDKLVEHSRKSKIRDFSIKTGCRSEENLIGKENLGKKSIPNAEPNLYELPRTMSNHLCGNISKTSSTSTISEPEETRQEIRLGRDDDTPEFLEFMKTIPLTADAEVDNEIYNFYRDKFSN